MRHIEYLLAKITRQQNERGFERAIWVYREAVDACIDSMELQMMGIKP